MITLGVSTLLIGILAALFVRWETIRRPDFVVITLLGLIVLDVSLFPDSAAANDSGIFVVEVAGQGLRLTQIAVLVAVAARLGVHGMPRRWISSLPLWVAFSCWMVIAAAVGYLAGNSTGLVLRHLSVLPVIAAGMLLVGGTPADLLVRRPQFRRFLTAAAALALLLLVVDTAGVFFTASTPLLTLQALGQYGADAGTVFSTLGMIGLTIGACIPRGGWARLSWILPSVVLILSLFATSQRAARLGLFVGLVILTVAALSRVGRRRLDISRLELLLTALVVAGLAATASMAVAVANPWDQPENRTTASQGFDNPFAATDRQGSIQSRFNQWDVAQSDIRDSALIGQGLGYTARRYEVGPKETVESDLFHNVILDVWVRTGLIGLLLAVSAATALNVEALKTWMRSRDDQVAALALAGIATFCALLAKGMVESVFEKDRLAVMIAVALGLMASATISDRGRPMKEIHLRLRPDPSLSKVAG